MDIGAFRTVTVDGGHQIRVFEAGSGPCVVFIHGSGPGAFGVSNFHGNIAPFLAAGFRVLAPDLLGYGESAKPTGIDYTLQLFADTLYAALRQCDVGEAVLIGNSLGGGVAMQIAFDHPGFVSKLVMMAPGCIEEREVYFKMPGIARMVEDFTSPDFTLQDQRNLLSRLVYDDSIITDQLVEERYRVARTQPKDVLARMRTPNLAPRLGELRMPILGFWGQNDAFCPVSGAGYFLSACDDCRFTIFSRVGHWVQVERREAFNQQTLSFLGR